MLSSGRQTRRLLCSQLLPRQGSHMVDECPQLIGSRSFGIPVHGCQRRPKLRHQTSLRSPWQPQAFDCADKSFRRLNWSLSGSFDEGYNLRRSGNKLRQGWGNCCRADWSVTGGTIDGPRPGRGGPGQSNKERNRFKLGRVVGRYLVDNRGDSAEDRNPAWESGTFSRHPSPGSGP